MKLISHPEVVLILPSFPIGGLLPPATVDDYPLGGLAASVCRLVDAHRHRQDEYVILTRIDGYPVAVAQAEPALGHLRYLVGRHTAYSIRDSYHRL